MTMNFERVSTSLFLIVLAGCASTSSPSLDVGAYGAEASSAAASTAPAAEPFEPVPVAFESPQRGDDKWELVVGGSGASDKQVDSGGGALGASIGHMLGNRFQVVLRENVDFSDSENTESVTNSSTRLGLDFIMGSSSFQPFIGANAGYVYGDRVHDTWEAAPEAGIKWFLRDGAFLQLMAEYQFFFEEGDELDNQFEDGSFVYSVGIGMTF